MPADMDGKVYVGNLPDDVRSTDIEDIFYKYGRVQNVDIKHGGGRGPPFAFLEFDDMRLVAYFPSNLSIPSPSIIINKYTFFTS